MDNTGRQKRTGKCPGGAGSEAFDAAAKHAGQAVEHKIGSQRQPENHISQSAIGSRATFHGVLSSTASEWNFGENGFRAGRLLWGITYRETGLPNCPTNVIKAGIFARLSSILV
jgi:hypothetical protein